MEVKEFGSDNSMKIVMIPGNMMCWKQFEHVIPLLEQDYHVIAISTDGYDGTGQKTFTTAEASAEKGQTCHEGGEATHASDVCNSLSVHSGLDDTKRLSGGHFRFLVHVLDSLH